MPRSLRELQGIKPGKVQVIKGRAMRSVLDASQGRSHPLGFTGSRI